MQDSNENLVGEGTIGIALGRAVSYGRQSLFTVVKLPCAEDGRSVDHILGCSQPDYLLDL